MKAPGIVRKIDNLGRLVIPKEIRNVLRIREGEQLEIFTGDRGKIIFKRYSPISEWSFFADKYADVLNKESGFPVLVCDRDQVIATAGIPQEDIRGHKISNELETKLRWREIYSGKRLKVVNGLNRRAIVGTAIKAGGTTYGYLLMLENDACSIANSEEVRLIKIAAAFLGANIEA